MTNSQRFAVEFDRRTVGIAVRVPGGFMFYASDHRFDGLDGKLFPRARAIERQLKRVADRVPAPNISLLKFTRLTTTSRARSPRNRGRTLISFRSIP